MFFNILTKNLGDTRAVESHAPIIDYLRTTLSACGHEVTVSYSRIYIEGINLLFEEFSDQGFTAEISQMRREKGIRIGIIATELMQEEGIPYARHGISYAGGADQEAVISRRLDGFAKVIRLADFVWSFLPRTAEYLSERVAISEWLPVGHVSNTPPELRRAPKDIDICFFGKMTPHRKSVIDLFADSGLQVVAVGKDFPPLGFFPWPLLGSVLDRSKIALNLTLHAADDSLGGTDPRFVSCMRMVEYLQRDICVVSEDIPLDNPYEDFMESAPIGDLPALCKRLLENGRWSELGHRRGENFRQVMDVRKLCLPVIERTLAAMEFDGA